MKKDRFYVARKSKITGKVEYQRCKCLDSFCSAEYIQNHPDSVWQFSRQGANGIVKRENERGWNYEYFIVPVENILL